MACEPYSSHSWPAENSSPDPGRSSRLRSVDQCASVNSVEQKWTAHSLLGVCAGQVEWLTLWLHFCTTQLPFCSLLFITSSVNNVLGTVTVASSSSLYLASSSRFEFGVNDGICFYFERFNYRIKRSRIFHLAQPNEHLGSVYSQIDVSSLFYIATTSQF